MKTNLEQIEAHAARIVQLLEELDTHAAEAESLVDLACSDQCDAAFAKAEGVIRDQRRRLELAEAELLLLRRYPNFSSTKGPSHG